VSWCVRSATTCGCWATWRTKSSCHAGKGGVSARLLHTLQRGSACNISTTCLPKLCFQWVCVHSSGFTGVVSAGLQVLDDVPACRHARPT
jgi:hypothetical protein